MDFSQQFPIVLSALNVGFLQTLKLFIVTLLGAIPLGLIISFGSMSKFKPLAYVMKIFVWIIRGTPLMLQIIIVFYGPGLMFGLPAMPRFTATIVAFAINYACYFSEIYRGGIESIPQGQYEAGQVLGMTKTQIFFKVTLLQMIKRIVPPMSNEIITLVKDTSLAYVIGVVEMFTRAKQINSAPGGMGLWAFLAAGVIYYVFNFIVTVVMDRVEKKMSYYQ